MTDLQVNLTADKFTYARRLGWVNTENKRNALGDVMVFNTKFNLPVVVPDQWDDQKFELARVPDDQGIIALSPDWENGPSIKLWIDVIPPPSMMWAWTINAMRSMKALEYHVSELSMNPDVGEKFVEWMIDNNKVPQKVTLHSKDTKDIAGMLRPHCLTLTG